VVAQGLVEPSPKPARALAGRPCDGGQPDGLLKALTKTVLETALDGDGPGARHHDYLGRRVERILLG
jgi:hypothetical protein